MKIDVNETAWLILETLHEHGKLNANQIQNKTKKINRITMYKAFPLLKKDGLIQRDKNKIYSLNTAKFLEAKQALKTYEEYADISQNASKIYKNLEKLLENHKMVLSDTESDVKIAQEALRSRDFVNLINTTIRIFQLGSGMEFLISTGLFPKTVEQKAIRLRRRNEDLCSKYLKTLLKVEPVIWREIIMLIQTKLASKIDYS